MRNSFSRLPVLALWLLCCSLPAVAQPVTSEELVNELTTILMLLETAQSEYETASTERATLRTELTQLQTEEMPRLLQQQADLRSSFDDYAQAVRQETRNLRLRLYLASGIAVVISVAAIVAAFH